MDSDERTEMDEANDSQIAQLLKLSGRRRMPRDAPMARARTLARAEWVRASRVQRWRVWRPVFTGAVAALLLLAAAAVWQRSSPPAPIVVGEVATLRTLVGPIMLTRDGEDREVRDPGLRLRAGDRVTSQVDSRAVLIFADGISLRLDRDSAITLDSGRITLVRGGAYVDTGPGSRGSALAIETPLGIVRHVGTQFEARLLGDTLYVRVREGTVVVERQSARWTSHAGELLMISPGQAAERHPSATSGPDWNWISELAEPFHLDGSTLESFLEWAGREQGWRVQFDSPETQRRAEPIVLRGSIEGLTPDEAVEAVLPTCGLIARREGDRLVISSKFKVQSSKKKE